MTLCKATPPAAMTEVVDVPPIGDFVIEPSTVGTCVENKGHSPLPHSDGEGHFWGDDHDG